ncbi:HlyD family type I secretion periplasmic adaptor subunit [Sabulicella rubraurantiaca]|uniref:HlyD family type I secretion periplasmic adaptor subunit n=1 Tax=Sabulicella rubraurantiaca TaxID=2811429 RepID=UPI001A959C15|nr:HlyD family type I secretion periplasmic adaptor subunit [Sabulicella rubraurantiaca]
MSDTTNALEVLERPALPARRALPPLAVPPADPVLDAQRPRTFWPALLGLVVMVVFFGGFMAWAVTAPLAEAAIAPGVIKVEGQRRTVQHFEGGIVREILVRDGDRVRQGQPLMRLDDVQSGANLEALRAQRFGLVAQAARLAAEMERAGEITFPAELLESQDPRAAEAVSGQRALFDARMASLASQLLVLETRRDQARATISSAEGQLNAAIQQLELIRQEEVMRRTLTNQGLARLPELLAVQRARAGLEGQIVDLRGQITRSRGAIGEAESQIRATLDQRRQEVGTEAREVAGRRAEAEERIRAAEDVSTRREILAPEDGTVVNLRLFNVGAVLRPGDPVVDLVPTQDRLVAEVNVQPTDIDVVYPGLQAEIRLPAFKQRLVPYLHGHVTFVAADVTIDQATRQSHFRAHVLIDREQLERLPSIFLTPGMPVEAHIQIGQRTFWRYVTQPIRDSLQRAFTEQ